jgi:hypothetical protein
VDRLASDVLAGDTIIDPHSGVVSRVLRAGVAGDMVVLHIRGLVASNSSHLSLKPDRPMRAWPRPERQAERPKI